MDLLSQITESVQWEAPEFRRTLICLDFSWCEILKWDCRNAPMSDSLHRCSIVSSEEYNKIVSLCSENQFERALFLTSSLLPEKVRRIKEILERSNAPECVVIGSVSSLNADLQFHKENSHEAILELLEPAKSSIYFFPYHSIRLLPVDQPKKVDLRILASTEFRNLKPLTLSGLSFGLDKFGEYKTIFDVPAADLPDKTKSVLKHLAHEIAEVLVFDLGSV
jgi:transposase